jgi:hypothetical protein
MKGWIRRTVLAGLVLVGAAEQRCTSTQVAGDCVNCQCQCQGASATATTTFERRDASGKLLALTCTVRGDCIAECTRVSAPTPISATCLTMQ